MQYSSDVTGIDYLSEPIREMADMGFDVIHADVEEFDTGSKYDYVVAGELIEHLSNPGKMLDCVRDHLRPSGKFIVTTPNPWYLFHGLSVWVGRAAWNEEHSAWFDKIVVTELIERHGFTVENSLFVAPSPWKLKLVYTHRNLARIAGKSLMRLGMNQMGANRLMIIASIG